jgi:hypothetical protein
VRYLAIVAANLDEFFQVRVAGLLTLASVSRRRDELTVDQQLKRSEAEPKLPARMERRSSQLIPALAEASLVAWGGLEDSQRKLLGELEREISRSSPAGGGPHPPPPRQPVAEPGGDINDGSAAERLPVSSSLSCPGSSTRRLHPFVPVERSSQPSHSLFRE